jgi:spermidine synthase
MPGIALLSLYIVVITLSSFLLFLIQPIAAKTLLPILGGVPAVWNTCMVFFQGVLLAGYLYAYLLSRYLSGRQQCLLHFSLSALSLSMLPVLISHLPPMSNSHPILYVLSTLLATISLPLFLLSATAPLVQNWFGHTNHPDAKDPYFLYSASNTGSLLALISFPLLLEPFIGRQTLSLTWSGLYGAFLLLLLLIGLQQRQQPITLDKNIPNPRRWQQRGYWLLLSFAPSSLLLAVTQFITTNVASIPLLWILPLALYLISFIIVFSRRPIISHEWIVNQAPYFLIFPLISLTQITFAAPASQLIAFHLLGFFALVMVCHGELAAARPDKLRLTEFYFWMSLGGFMGGMFNSLIAPFIFNDVYEYYIAICLCLFLSPAIAKSKMPLRAWVTHPLIIIALLSAAYFVQHYLHPFAYTSLSVTLIEIAAITMIILWHQWPRLFALNVAILFLFSQSLVWSSFGELIWHSRNFFGVSRIYSDRETNLHVYIDGVTMHGAQVLSDTSGKKTLTYYRPIYQLAASFKQDKPINIAIAGLGAGTLSCAFKNTHMTFFEINPAVADIAKTPEFFTYLKECPPQGGIILGDARNEIARTPNHAFDIILLDAFTSDSIPVHLITIDALKLYLSKLSTNGLLIFNVTNTHVDLKPLLYAMAKELNLQILSYDNSPKASLEFPSNWIILTDNQQTADTLKRQYNWRTLSYANPPAAWTDDFSNILRALK